jgi:stage IV sporulation protein FB
VLLQEPERTRGDLNFSLLGMPVRISPWFWVISVMMGIQLNDPALLLIWVSAVFISILWHEMGHALVIRAIGFRPWITLYGMGGLASYDPARHRRFVGVTSWEQIAISFAGPAAGFLLAALLAGILLAAGYGEHLSFKRPFFLPSVEKLPNFRLEFLLNQVFFISVLWGLVNLLPVYPLDGGQIARELFLRFNLRDGIRQSLRLSIVTAILFGIYAAMEWRQFFVLLLFGFLAYENYQALQSSMGRGK